MSRIISILAVGWLVVAGCAQTEDPVSMPEPVDPARLVVESSLSSFEEVMSQAARMRAIRAAMKEVIEVEGARPFAARVEDGLRYSTVFQREYIDEGVGPFFVGPRGINARGEEVLLALAESDRHVLEAETLHREVIEELLRQSDDLIVEVWEFEAFTPNVEEAEALVEKVREAIEQDGEEAGRRLVVEVISEVDEEASPVLSRFAQYQREQASNFAQAARALAWLELRLADGSLRYAREMRHANLERVDWRQMRDAGGSTEVILSRMQATLRDLGDAEPEEVARVFQALEPSHKQYRALLAALDRYRGYVEQGDWEQVRPFSVELGESSERVVALRERLEAEDIKARPADQDDEFDPSVVDETLIDGIRHYQRTHQFKVDGDPSPGFWRSLNLSAAHRVGQMELTLARWRESSIEDDRDFIFVNIPSFEAAVWTDGEQRMAFDVVVGRNQRRCDRETRRWEYPDATPVVMSKMDHIMFNPPWYVPDRLVRETLMPRLAADPDYFENEGYEEVTLADGRQVVRQLPGEDNALGQVKFIFPNEHNVYLHDTPQRHYFEYDIRAYSAGCVRVSKPVELAKFLVQWKGRGDLDVDSILEGDRTIRIDFERELPVFIEYYTVWVDEAGEPNFLADIYRKDARRRAEDPEEFDRCTPRRVVVQEEEESTDQDSDLEDVEVDEGEAEERPEDLSEDLGP